MFNKKNVIMQLTKEVKLKRMVDNKIVKTVNVTINFEGTQITGYSIHDENNIWSNSKMSHNYYDVKKFYEKIQSKLKTIFEFENFKNNLVKSEYKF